MRSRSDTPRTNAVAASYKTSWLERFEMMTKHAMMLEDELNATAEANWRTQALEWRRCAETLADHTIDPDAQPPEWQVGLDMYLSLSERYSTPSDPNDGRAFDAEERGEMPEEEA